MTTSTSQTIKPGVASPGMAARLGHTIDERRGVEYHELHAKDLVNKLNAKPMPFGWTVNPYRGCELACRYCFARYTHEFLGLNDPAEFERKIYVKETALARRPEPRAPPPDLRFGAMRELARAGVATRLFIMPILPGLTDDEPNLQSLLVLAHDAGAIGAESNVLFLRPGTRETFFQFLAVDFPRLVPEYERLYPPSAYAPPNYVREVEQRVRSLAAEVGLSARRRADRPDPRAPRQLSLVW